MYANFILKKFLFICIFYYLHTPKRGNLEEKMHFLLKKIGHIKKMQ